MGSGLIVTSGKTVTGQETAFRSEIDKGDVLSVENALLKTKE